MCGIAGWSRPGHPAEDLSQLSAMTNAIAHRGPDDHGVFTRAEDGVALGHVRLSIIDLSSGGHQPMASDDASVVLAFNGELYNFKALRRELEALGRNFRSHSDTEVAVNALAQWGPQALERFDGMFALAAWFAASRKLLLARDPLGMKPLYYTSLSRGGIAFASEIKAFLPLSGFKAGLDRVSLRQYLEFGYVFDPSRTSLTGVEKLPPGHAMEIEAGKGSVPFAYFSPMTKASERHATTPIEDRLHDTLSTVVREHLVADVPVGLLLSGGLDSSVIAALAARDTRVSTISMGFAESAVDERAFARMVASHVGSDHREILIHASDMLRELENSVWYFDDLFADWGTLSTRMMYMKCREQGIKVVLVGEGADELFGGYSVFEAARQGRGPLAWRLFQLYRRYAGRRYGSQYGAFASIMRKYLSQCGGDMFAAVRLFESCNQLPNNYVMKVDKASMSVSVEARAPYLDRRVAELAFSIPGESLLAEGTNKLALRRMAERHKLLPSEITRRPKFGASIAASWMDDSIEFRRYAADKILSRDGWADRLGLRPAMSDFFSGRRAGYRFPHAISIFSNLAWRLLLLDLWSKKYLSAQ